MASATASPGTVASPGGLRIIGAVPAPNPDPEALLVDLAGPADGVQVRIWSVAWRLLLTVPGPGGGPGWVRVRLPAGWLASAADGTYYYSVQARQGARESARVLGRLVVLH